MARPIAIQIAGGHANCLALAVGQCFAGNIDKAAAIPFEHQITKAVSGDKQFKFAIIVHIGNSKAIAQLGRVIENECGFVGEHTNKCGGARGWPV